MASLEDFFKAQYAARTAEDMLALPAPDATSVKTAFGKLPAYFGTTGVAFDALFKPDLTVRIPKLKALSPLTVSMLKAKRAAGYDLKALRYGLYVDMQHVVHCGFDHPHIDGIINPKTLIRNIISTGQTSKTIISDIYPTITVPVSAMIASCPDGLDRARYFLCMLEALKSPGSTKLAASGGIVPHTLPWHTVLPEFGEDFKTASMQRLFIARLLQAAEEILKDKCVVPDRATAVHFNHMTLHAYSCTEVPPDTPGSQVRRRAMLDIGPAQ